MFTKLQEAPKTQVHRPQSQGIGRGEVVEAYSWRLGEREGFYSCCSEKPVQGPGEGVSWFGDESSLSRERRSGKYNPSRF